MAASVFGLEPQEFWTSPWRTEEQLIDRYQFDEQYGIYIDLPPRVDLNERETVPMLFVYAAPEREAYHVYLERMAKVVIVRLEDRRTFVASAVELGEPRKEPPRMGRDSDAPTSRRLLTNLARQAPITERPGRYLVTALLRDRASNRVATLVERPPTGYQDPEVAKFLAAQRQQAAPPAPRPASPRAGLPFPAYGVVEGAPAVPKAPGIALAIERVILTRPGARAVLRGSFRLPVLALDHVPPPREPREGEAPLPDYGEPRPTAIVPITLVSLGTTVDHQQVFDLRVPVYAVEGAGDAAQGTGQFAIDLFANDLIRLSAQTNFIWAFCGELMAGPCPMATVTEAMLPKPGE